MKIKTRDLTQNAVLASITVLLFLLHKFVPLLGMIGTLLCAVPIILAAVKNNFQQGVFICLASFFLISLLSGIFSGIFFLFEFAAIGLAISYSLSKKYSTKKLFLFSTVAVMISTIILYMTLSMLFKNNELDPANIQKALVRDFQKVKTEIISKLKTEPDISPMDLKRIEENINFIILKTKEAHYYFPIMLIWASVFSTFLTYYIAFLVLSRLKVPIPPLPSFDYFYIPWSFIWGLILGGALVKLEISFIATKIGENILYSFLIIYFVTGLSIAKFFLNKSSLPVILKGFLFISLFFFFQPIPFLLGIFDNLVDFRKIRIDDIGSLKLYGKKRDITEI